MNSLLVQIILVTIILRCVRDESATLWGGTTLLPRQGSTVNHSVTLLRNKIEVQMSPTTVAN